MGDTSNSSSSGSPAPSSSSLSSTSQLAASSQQTAAVSGSILESIVSQSSATNSEKQIASEANSGNSGKSIAKIDSKGYLLSDKLTISDKQKALYKWEKENAAQAKQESSKKTKYVEADVFTTSKKCYGTMTPTNPNSNKPIRMSDTTQVLMTVFKDSLDSMAFNADLFTSLSWKLLKQIYGNGTEKMPLPCAEAAYVCY